MQQTETKIKKFLCKDKQNGKESNIPIGSPAGGATDPSSPEHIFKTIRTNNTSFFTPHPSRNRKKNL